MKNKSIKICFTASAGGHLEEISQLKELESKYENFLITEKIKGFDTNSLFKKIYFVPYNNDKRKIFIFKECYTFLKSFFILKKEKPNYIISTGAISPCLVCMAGKLLGIKIIYIESFARCSSLSVTGKMMMKIADKFIVQWEELLEECPNATYGGGIF